MSEIFTNPAFHESLGGGKPDELTHWLTPESSNDPQVQANIQRMLSTPDGRAELDRLASDWEKQGIMAPWRSADRPVDDLGPAENPRQPTDGRPPIEE